MPAVLKRKLAQDSDICQAGQVTTIKKQSGRQVFVELEQTSSGLNRHTSVKRRRDEAVCKTPQGQRFKDVLPPTPSATPSKSASALFDTLKLSANDSENQSEPIGSYATPPITPSSSHSKGYVESQAHPQSLQDLSRLLAAFLSAISLYLAHHGEASSLFLSDLLPVITQTWRKREVTEHDVRLVLGLQDELFKIVDNGRDCSKSLETMQFSASNLVMKQQELCARFDASIARRWKRWSATAGLDTEESFFESLPLAEIHQSATDASSRRPNKGQRRLEMFRQDSAKARQDSTSASRATLASAESKTSAGVSNRANSLLDKVLVKQRLAASGPRPPTAQEMARNAALDRIEEAAMTMSLLVGTKPRVSHSMQGMIKHLQDSLRNSISKEEAVLCLELMATNVMPGYISLIKNGGLCGVVIKRAGKPSSAALERALIAARDF